MNTDSTASLHAMCGHTWAVIIPGAAGQDGVRGEVGEVHSEGPGQGGVLGLGVVK